MTPTPFTTYLTTTIFNSVSTQFAVTLPHTLPQLEKKEKEMTTEQNRIAIAEACGFSNINSVCWRGHAALHERQIPDYFSDLNAMHEVEKVLTTEQWLSYWSFLSEVLKDTSILHADASQRAEAFGLTLNLWK